MPVPHNGDTTRSNRARARTAGFRSAVLVTLVAAGVAACVSAGSEPEPAPRRVPASAGSVADGPSGGRVEPEGVRPAGKNGMSPSPTASAGPSSPGATTPAATPTRAPRKPVGRDLPEPAGGGTVPQPTAQESPTQAPPPDSAPPADPTTAPPTDPPSQTTGPDPGGSPPPAAQN
ncbi:hypothetical protein [Actinacidiphila sp. ITFR-21]|uniref:hypothetical protein n=1 Tax=Actinacidiphila sp. ITFR-21 TaxID=3075199 RepID=UPI00288BD54D|nr:hypothetical protein [Streptomyces sp. ITFR-21]WNI16265.1 hypothetical protein RLT57_12490 [Streptomyces sp. ITFR-21]